LFFFIIIIFFFSLSASSPLFRSSLFLLGVGPSGFGSLLHSPASVLFRTRDGSPLITVPCLHFARFAFHQPPPATR
jgi:hypothetical protein